MYRIYNDFYGDLTPEQRLKQMAERYGITEKTEAERIARRMEAEANFKAEQKTHLKEYAKEIDSATMENRLEEYFEEKEIYDFKWLLDKDGHYNGVILMLAFGGPAIYLDTFDGTLSLHWGSVNVYEKLDGVITDRIADYFEPFCPYSKEWR